MGGVDGQTGRSNWLRFMSMAYGCPCDIGLSRTKDVWLSLDEMSHHLIGCKVYDETGFHTFGCVPCIAH